MAILSSLFVCTLFALSTSAAVPKPRPRQEQALNLRVVHSGGDLEPVLSANFPDPSVIQGKDGKWYAFATNTGSKANGNYIAVQVAEADDPLGQWTLLDEDAMPEVTWFTGSNTWAPDVRELDDGSYILYFSGEYPPSPHQHCIGVARSDSVKGPFVPDRDPWVCPTKDGGAIDASGFKDGDKRYVVYKVDGNSKGAPSQCGTGVDDPALRTPIMLQRVEADGATKIGNPVEILDRSRPEDGALVEAPNLVRRGDGTYVLWYSSHCFTDPLYDVKYAYSSSIEGPYTRSEGPLLKAPDFGLAAPGGATSRTQDGEDFLVFHGNCDAGRCLYSVKYEAE
jgi:beta-xylosidase